MDYEPLEGPIAFAFKVEDPKFGCVLKINWKLPEGWVWEEFAAAFAKAKYVIEIQRPKGTVRLPVLVQGANGTFSGADQLTAALGPRYKPVDFPSGSRVRFIPQK